MSSLRANSILLLAAFIWGTAFVAQQTGMEDVGALTFTWTRFLLGALIVLPFALREHRRRKQGGGSLARRDVAGIGVIGLVLFFAAVTQQIGVGATTVTNSGFLTTLYVVLVPLMSLVFFRHAVHWSVWPAAAGCLGGTYLIGGGALSGLSTGDLWILTSACLWALHVILIGVFCRSSDAPLALACTQFLICAVLSAAAAPLMGETFVIESVIAAGPEILYAGGLSVGVAYTLQVVAQKHTPAPVAALILSTEALFAALAGAAIQGERLNLAEGLGCALILASIVAVQILPGLRKSSPAQA